MAIDMIELREQLAWSPPQFDRLLGKKTGWTYYQIRHGKLKAIQAGGDGRLLIPRAEGLRFLGMDESDVGPERKRA